MFESLVDSHRDDHDGGYYLVDSIVGYAKTLPPSEKDNLRTHLLRLVDSTAAHLWGVALEALVRGWGSSIAPALGTMAEGGSHSDQWERHVLLALLNLRFPAIAERANRFVASKVAVGDYGVMPVAASLAKLDSESSLKALTSLLMHASRADQLGWIEGNIPGIAIHLCNAQKTLVSQLVLRIAAVDRNAAAQVAGMFVEYFDSPEAKAREGEGADSDLIMYSHGSF